MLAGVKAAVDGVIAQVVLLDVEPVLTKRALELADEFGPSASSDAPYLALAEHPDCELRTADQRLWNTTRQTLPSVRRVGEDGAP